MEQKNLDIPQINMDGDKLWGGDLGLEGKRGNGEIRGKVYKMGFWTGQKNTGLLSERGN